MGSFQVEHTRTERRVLGQINHPFIVALHFAFQTDQKLYFVLDYCAGGELFYHLSRMKKVGRYCCQALPSARDTHCILVTMALLCLVGCLYSSQSIWQGSMLLK